MGIAKIGNIAVTTAKVAAWVAGLTLVAVLAIAGALGWALKDYDYELYEE